MRSFVRLTAIVFFSTISALFADSAADSANANREYAAGHFQAATEGYEALVRAGQTNRLLFYNLGNAWYRRGDLARAILNYERACARATSCRSDCEFAIGTGSSTRAGADSGMAGAFSCLDRFRFIRLDGGDRILDRHLCIGGIWISPFHGQSSDDDCRFPFLR